LAVLLLAHAAVAQTVNPRFIEFAPSPDHATVTNGSPVVTEYVVTIFVVGQPTPVKTLSVGKPSPGADGKIRAAVFSGELPFLTPGVQYESRVAASGPRGVSPSVASNPFEFTANCSVRVAVPKYAIAPAGGRGSVTLVSPTSCLWQTSSSASWLTIAAGASGTGDAVVVFAAAANPGGPRSATLTIGDKVVTVTQADVPCTYTITPVSLPMPVTVNVAGALSYTWPELANDRRALRRAAAGRVAAAWYGERFTVDINVAGGLAQEVAVYVADYDSAGRQEVLEVFSDAGRLLDTRTVSNFSGGQYWVWRVTGHVAIRVGHSAGPNAVLSGVFLGATSTGSGTSATFVRTDSTTGGDWGSSYGSGGYAIAADVTTQWLSPAGGPATLAVNAPPNCGWTAVSTVPWLTVKAGASGRGPGTVTLDIGSSTSARRTGAVNVNGQLFTLTQAAVRSTATVPRAPANVLAPSPLFTMVSPPAR
jgi:hypothetical protein